MNDTGTLTLSEFLLARIAEDEVVARATASGWTGPEAMGAIEGGFTVFVDPARVLAECEAKRRIADLHKNEGVHSPSCLTCAGEVDPDGHTEWMHWPCDTILLLALPYAGHPDYREEWRP